MASKTKLTVDVGDRDFTGIIICAVRYCLGRRTYMPGLVTNWIKRNLDGKLYDVDIDVMIADINRQENDFGLGDPCDVQVWHQFMGWLVSQKQKAIDKT